MLINGVMHYPEEVVKRTAHDLGLVLVRETVLTIQIELLEAAKKELEEENTNLRARAIAQQTDIDGLREQLGAKPKKRVGVLTAKRTTGMKSATDSV